MITTIYSVSQCLKIASHIFLCWTLIAAFTPSPQTLVESLGVAATDVAGEVLRHYNEGRNYQYNSYCKDNDIGPAECNQRIIQNYLAVVQYVQGNPHQLMTLSNKIDYPGMLNDLGIIFTYIDEKEKAAYVFREAISINPKLTSSIGNLAALECRFGNIEEASNLYELGISIDPNNSGIYYNYGLLVYEYYKSFPVRLDGTLDRPLKFQHWNKEFIRKLWVKSTELNPDLYQAYSNLAVLESKSQDDENMSETYLSLAMMAAVRSDQMGAFWSQLFLKYASRIPVIVPISSHFNSTTAQINHMRCDYYRSLAFISTHMPLNAFLNVIEAAGNTFLGYYVVYHGYEDIFLRQTFANIYWTMSYATIRYIAPIQEPKADLSIQPSRKKCKVGFLSAFFYRHSVGLLLQGVIKQLALQRSNDFEIYVILLSNQLLSKNHDKVLTALKNSPNVNFIELSSEQHISKLQLNIGSLNLDVLVFGEIGMDLTTYFLAFSRLTRRSVVFWGHAVTSGISEQLFRHRMMSPTDLETNNTSNGSITPDDEALVLRYSTTRDEPRKYPDTTHLDCGGPDYFVSSKLFEMNSDFAQFEYSERLILLNGMTTYFEWPNHPLSAGEFQSLSQQEASDNNIIHKSSRSEKSPKTYTARVDSLKKWGLLPMVKSLGYLNRNNDHNQSDDAIEIPLPQKREFLLYLEPSFVDTLPFEFTLYSIPQTLYKLHRDFDNILQGILLRDDTAIIVFPADSSGHHDKVTKELSRRLEISLAASLTQGIVSRSRLFFVRQMDEREYLTFCSIADVILDPFPVGGGRSSLEIFSVGSPIIVLNARTSILQLTAGMYATMGLNRISWREDDDNTSSMKDSNRYTCCVANTIDEYIHMATAVGSHLKFQSHIRGLIQMNSYRLYENASVIDEWASMLHFISNSDRPSPDIMTFQDIEDELLHNDDNNTTTLHLQRAKDFLSSGDHLWEPSELKRALFTYPRYPPITLSDMQAVLTVEQQGLEDRIPKLLYSGSFQHVSTTGSIIPGNQVVVRIFEGEDWRSKCLDEIITYKVMDRLKIIYICSIIGRAVERLQWDTFASIPITIANVTNKKLMSSEFIIKIGDDMAQIINTFSVTIGDVAPDSLDSLVNYINNNMIDVDTAGSVEWVEKRRAVVRSFLQYIARFQRNITQETKATRSTLPHPLALFSRVRDACFKDTMKILEEEDTAAITLVMPTSKRLRHFLTSMTSLVKALGPLPNTLITNVIIIDDASSLEDRKQMLEHFPTFTFLFKSISSASGEFGHPRTMNIMARHITTKYVLYLEDDWKLLDHFVLHPDWRQQLEDMKLSVHNINGGRSSSITDFHGLLVNCLAILGFNGVARVPVVASCSNNNTDGFISIEISSLTKSASSREPIHEILFNEQSRRYCAEGKSSCTSDITNIGTGGWKRSLRTQWRLLSGLNQSHQNPAAPGTTLTTYLSYSLHEFGLVPITEYQPSQRNHGFTNWPGLSFHPGIWDFQAIKERMMDCIEEDHGKGNGDRNMFDETESGFEHRYSTLGLATGLNMAFLPAVLFEDISEGMSAYTLNGVARPWDQEYL